MKKNICLLLVLLLSSLYTFSQTSKEVHAKVDKQIQTINQLQDLPVFQIPNAAFEELKKYNADENMQVSFKKKQLVKIQYYAKLGNAGNYESITIYLRNKKPIFIEREKKETITARHTNGNVESFPFVNKSKTYVQNWKKNEVAYLLWDEQTDTYQSVKKEMSDIIYTAEKKDAIRLIDPAEKFRQINKL